MKEKTNRKVNLEDFGFANFGEYYHDVNIHLINGEVITILENEDLPNEKTIFNEFICGKSSHLNVVVGIDGVASIPKDKILYIVTCNIHKV